MHRTARGRSWLLSLAFFVLLAACQAEPVDSPENAAETNTDTTPATADRTRSPVGKINLNTATPEEFMTIPEVGERMVGEFMEYRPYVSIQQFRQEIGKYVSEEQVAAYEEYVYVPVQPDESDAETLQQLPGIDAGESQQLIERRPYGSDESFISALSEFATPDEVTEATPYLAAR